MSARESGVGETMGGLVLRKKAKKNNGREERACGELRTQDGRKISTKVGSPEDFYFRLKSKVFSL